MSFQFDPSTLLREARTGAGLTQRALAVRAGTSQSVIARIEKGQTSPTVATLTRLLAAAGYGLDSHLTPAPTSNSHMLEDIARILAMTPEDRLIEVRNVSRLVVSAERV
jgi:transcriptional regulator with XRE-family HTH domain